MGSAMNSKQQNDMGFSIKKTAPLFILALIFASFFIFDLGHYLSFQALSENRDKLLEFVSDNYFAAVALYFLIYAVSVAASFPGGLLLTVTGGFLFGWVVAGSVTVFAATLGATLLFIIAKTSLGESLREKAGPRLARLEAGFRDNAMSYLLFLRLVPAFPFWLVNIAPAFLGVPLRTYVIGTFVGIIPGTYVFAFLGTGLDSVIVEQQDKYNACIESAKTECSFTFDVASLLTTEIILSFVALGIISLCPIVIKRFRKTHI